MAETLKVESKPLGEVFYMEMTEPQADARLGKLEKGRVVAVDRDKAMRYLTARIAKQTTESAFDAQQKKKDDRVSRQQETFARLNAGYDAWDVSTYRDVLSAPESGLRAAHERGIPLVNVHYLKDENGDVLAPDADIEDILDARELLHQDELAPLAQHTRSSVYGGGSHLQQPAPLSPAHRAMMERVAEQEKMAQKPADFSYTADDEGARSRRRDPGERAKRAERRAAGRPAKDSDAKPASGAQVGN